MAIQTESVRYGDGYSGYLCRPERAASALPAVVVLQEAWGVDDHIEDVARRFAGAGYVALAPDLFARGGARAPGLERDRLAELLALVNIMPPGTWGDPKAREAAMATRPADAAARLTASFAAVASALADLTRYVPQLVATTSYLRDECAASRGQKVASVGFCMGGGL